MCDPVTEAKTLATVLALFENQEARIAELERELVIHRQCLASVNATQGSFLEAIRALLHLSVQISPSKR